MKSFLFLLLFAAGATGAPAADKLIPVDDSGIRKLIAEHKGAVILLSFWATWCEPCRAEMPLLVALDARLRPKGLQLITISADEPEQENDALLFAKQKSVRMPAYIKRAKKDEEFINSIDPKWSGALPALFLYDRTGKRVKSWIGETDVKAVEFAIAKLLQIPARTVSGTSRGFLGSR